MLKIEFYKKLFQIRVKCKWRKYKNNHGRCYNFTNIFYIIKLYYGYYGYGYI